MSRRTRYFEKFPLTEYDSVPSVNILKRAAFNEKVKGFITAFYTHTIPAGERIENIAFNYYDDVDYDWLIYHANDIVDPYFQVPLSNEDFTNYIVQKYGSEQLARRKTIHYKNNYESDVQVLSTAGYAALATGQKKYWSPVLSTVGVSGYERAEEDFIASTNKIETFDILSVTGTFQKDEVIVQDSDSTSFAEVSSANTTNLIIRHVRGDFSANTNYTITGEQSGATATVNADSYALLSEVIPSTEQVYYSPVSFYDYEEDLNEQRREIYLVQDSYRSTLNDQLKNLMR